ncbi:MAG: hypothetical protein Q4E74_03860 [Ruminococcus sp.]|nr:hypothetical protein [Ruminococcus sp.]
MTLLITFIAAIIVTVIWYLSANARELNVGLLCYMYWGASLMWLVDAIFEYSEMGAEFFAPSGADMINDTYLGISVTVLGLIVWTAVLLIKDPKGTVKNVLSKK